MFSIKHLKLTIYVYETNKTYIIEGLPITSTVEKTGGEGLQHARIVVSGLAKDTLEALTVLEFSKKAPRVNEILLEAREGENSQYSTVFRGNAICALPVYETNGTAKLEIEANSGYLSTIKPSPPVSVNQPTQATQLFDMFAKDGGLELDKEALKDVTVQNCTFTGSPRKKAQQLAKQIGCDFFIDDNKMVVRDFQQTTDSGAVVVSVTTGMLGYPKFVHTGITVNCLYNPLFELGKQIKVVSTIKQANANWILCKITHKLDAYQPSGGQWVSELEGYPASGGVNRFGR